jgi:hypothetical protein
MNPPAVLWSRLTYWLRRWAGAAPRPHREPLEPGDLRALKDEPPAAELPERVTVRTEPIKNE